MATIRFTLNRKAQTANVRSEVLPFFVLYNTLGLFGAKSGRGMASAVPAPAGGSHNRQADLPPARPGAGTGVTGPGPE